MDQRLSLVETHSQLGEMKCFSVFIAWANQSVVLQLLGTAVGGEESTCKEALRAAFTMRDGLCWR